MGTSALPLFFSFIIHILCPTTWLSQVPFIPILNCTHIHMLVLYSSLKDLLALIEGSSLYCRSLWNRDNFEMRDSWEVRGTGRESRNIFWISNCCSCTRKADNEKKGGAGGNKIRRKKGQAILGPLVSLMLVIMDLFSAAVLESRYIVHICKSNVNTIAEPSSRLTGHLKQPITSPIPEYFSNPLSDSDQLAFSINPSQPREALKNKSWCFRPMCYYFIPVDCAPLYFTSWVFFIYHFLN